MAAPRAVVVTRPTEYEDLLARHGTRRAVAFFLEQRGQDLDGLDGRHGRHQAALASVAAAVPDEWRRSTVRRDDLDRWLFEADDVIITVGQDGLVANVAKYLGGQPVIGVNPEGSQGPLARTRAAEVARLLAKIGAGGRTAVATELRSMVEVVADDGQMLRALNDVYIGSTGHQSARYDLVQDDGRLEPQSSSGIVVGTGTGSTGWCASLWNDRRPEWRLPDAAADRLCWFVREAWPSPTTGVTLTSGLLDRGDVLRLVVRSDGLVVFGDGIEGDRIELLWGQELTVGVASTELRLVGEGGEVKRTAASAASP